MPRGQKICNKCGTFTGPRAFVCKNCGYSFAFKAKSKEQRATRIIKDINWKELQKGDIIKVTGGPYFYYNGNFEIELNERYAEFDHAAYMLVFRSDFVFRDPEHLFIATNLPTA